MKHRMVVALLASSFTADVACSADWPLTASRFDRAGRVMPVEWTGLYFGVNAGYGWAQGSTDTFFTGPFFGGTTTPLGLGATELSATRLNGSGNPSGGIAGGQIGFNWQSGMAVFGAELDGQWSGQQNSFTVACTIGCTAAETVKIRSLATGRARLGLAFDWIMPYVTAGGALINVSDDLNVTAGGVTGTFQSLSGSTLGWTAGAGVEVTLWSNWSAKLEYLHISVDDLSATTPIPNALGLGTASEGASYRDNIVRVGLNYRFGPRGGPGMLEASLAGSPAYGSAYDFLPVVAMPADKARSTKRHEAAPVIAGNAGQQPPRAANESKLAKSAVKNFDEVENADATDGASAEPKPIKHSSNTQRQKGEDERQRLKRIIAICAGC
jgi:opacity protein-like surface antigen